MVYSIKSIEALDQSEGPFLRLLDLTATLFQCRTAVVSFLDGNQTVARSSGYLCTERIDRSLTLADRRARRAVPQVIIIPDMMDDPVLCHHPIGAGPGRARFVAAAPITDGKGTVIGALSVAHNEPHVLFGDHQVEELEMLAGMADDIVAGIEAARIRDERIESLKLVEQMSGVGHWRLDRDTGAVEWSDMVYQIHGVDRASFDPTTQALYEDFMPEDGDRLKALVQRAFETGEGYVTRIRVRNAAGERRRVETRAETEKDDKGRVTALYGVFQDVTDQELLLHQAQRSEARYRLLAENIGDVLTRVKTDGTSKYISPAIQQLLGWTYEEMSGQSMDYVHPEDRGLVLGAIRKAVELGEPTRLEHRAIHRAGHVVWVECTFRAVRGDNGALDDVIVVIRDISPRKLLEDEVIEAKERAEKAAAAKSEFLANMSHELRTPLTSVIGFAGLLSKSEALPAQERVYAERISTASEVLLEVINDILDYSKLEADAIELDPVTFGVRDLIEGAAAIVEGQCQAKGLALSVACDLALPDRLSGDVGRLRQVTLNFLSNAVKFTGRGGVRLAARGQPLDDGRWQLRIEVQDTGIGIPPETVPLLFDRFTQADASTTRLYGGTGLGLAISQRLITLMGGQIGVDSQPGHGSTFWFEVPLAPGGTGDAATATNGLDGTMPLGGARLLMADDAPANRELVTAILNGLGLEVHTVQDGAEAVQAMQGGGYDLVLMDVHMPVMDGLAATQEIRRMERVRGGRTPILALTANVQADQVTRCLDCGMDGHLAKPIQIPELVAALAHWLGAGDGEAAASRTAKG